MATMTWDKAFKAIAKICDALKDGPRPLTGMRSILERERFTNDQISTVFTFLRMHGIVRDITNADDVRCWELTEFRDRL